MEDSILDPFQDFREKSLKENLISTCKLLNLQAGTEIVRPGQYIKQLPFVVTGSIKVIREDEDGHEILIYYIKRGESCALSLSSFLNNETSPIKAVTTEATTLLAIPTQYMQEWQKKYPSWQEFVFRLYHDRFKELLNTIDEIAFKKVDARLITYLEQKSKISGSDSLQITHQQIAEDLGTSREVISRLLKDLERKGMLKLSRNFLRIVDLM